MITPSVRPRIVHRETVFMAGSLQADPKAVGQRLTLVAGGRRREEGG